MTTQTKINANHSYNKAVSGASIMNDLKVISYFETQGILAHPRQDVFTFGVWKHKFNRVVKRGQKGVKITTFIPRENKTNGKKQVFPRTVSVFHYSQTEELKSK